MSALDDHSFMGWEPTDPDCYGDCCAVGDRITSGDVIGTVCWKGWSQRSNCCRIGVSVGPGPLTFVDCRDVQPAEAAQ